MEEATSNSSQPSNSALTVHTHLAQKSAQNYFIDVSEKVSNQHFTVIFKEKVKLSVLDILLGMKDIKWKRLEHVRFFSSLGIIQG